MWPLKTAQRAIIVGGCCGMAYTQLTMSAASIDFVRNLGGTGLHVGILNALPVGMLFLQFLAAVVANRLTYRRRLWMWLSLLQRTIIVPVAFGPVLWPAISDAAWTIAFLAAIAFNQGLLHFCTPLWLSWMGDYLPHAELSTYWGVRQRWMQWTAVSSLLFGALLLHQMDLGVRIGYPVLAGIAAVFGVVDILMFLKVEEPRVTPLPDPNLRRVLLGPFLHRGFRSFIGFMCFWHFTAMIGAAFISLFLLQYVGMTLFSLLLLWSCSWTGGAMMSQWMGRLADRFGNKPLLVLCVAFKSINMIALLAIPRDPAVAFAVLVPVFMVDAALNAGFSIATNGFLLKNSPAENRTMYIASGTALAGLVGGITAILSGGVLSALGDWSVLIGSRSYTGFHFLFTISLALRFIAAGIVSRIHEPESYDTVQVVTQLIGVTPLRVMRYPVGLYRSWNRKELDKRRRAGEPKGSHRESNDHQTPDS